MKVSQSTRQSVNYELSVIIPAYNAESWIRPTTDRLIAAIKKAAIKHAEIIIVDDGSTDGTLTAIKEAASQSSVKIIPITQPNKGRFLARKNGVMKARYDTILFIDTRVWIDETSLQYVVAQRRAHPERRIWNGDVEVAKEGDIIARSIARFGDAVTQVGWRKYHSNPRLVSYTLVDFDYYPKGTTIFIAPTELIKASIKWFESQTKDIRNSSDDTLMIRYMAGEERIWISPKFTSTYFARTTLRSFISHTYHRGLFFVDGFLRPGTRFFVPLLVFLALSLGGLIGAIVFPQLWLPALVLVVAVWLCELATALLLRLSVADSLALFALSPLFAVMYGLGIWRAVLHRLFVAR